MLNYAPIDTYCRMLQTLNELSAQQVSGCLPDEMLGKIAAAGASLLPVSICSIWRREAAPAPGLLRLEAVCGGGRGRTLSPVVKLSESISQQVLENERPLVISDLTALPPSAEGIMAGGFGLNALVCVPVFINGQHPGGVLIGFAEDGHAFSDLEALLAEALARQIGVVWHMEALQGQTQRMKTELETRKRVDRAKEILVDQRRMTAEEAYGWIRKRSMDTRRSMREVAETIILAEETGHYSSIPHALDLFSKLPRK